MDREVIRCKTCGLVQYRTRTWQLPAMRSSLAAAAGVLIPEAEPRRKPGRARDDKFANQKTVENIGQRIRQLRESAG